MKCPISLIAQLLLLANLALARMTWAQPFIEVLQVVPCGDNVHLIVQTSMISENPFSGGELRDVRQYLLIYRLQPSNAAHEREAVLSAVHELPQSPAPDQPAEFILSCENRIIRMTEAGPWPVVSDISEFVPQRIDLLAPDASGAWTMRTTWRADHRFNVSPSVRWLALQDPEPRIIDLATLQPLDDRTNDELWQVIREQFRGEMGGLTDNLDYALARSDIMHMYDRASDTISPVPEFIEKVGGAQIQRRGERWLFLYASKDRSQIMIADEQAVIGHLDLAWLREHGIESGGMSWNTEAGQILRWSGFQHIARTRPKATKDLHFALWKYEPEPDELTYGRIDVVAAFEWHRRGYEPRQP